MSTEFLPVLIVFGLCFLVVAGMLGAAAVTGPRSKNPVKDAPFECGNPSFGTQGKRYAIKYFLVAIVFLLFDLETVYLYPWATLFQKLGFFGFVEMALFLLVLTAGLAYVWKKGALKWE